MRRNAEMRDRSFRLTRIRTRKYVRNVDVYESESETDVICPSMWHAIDPSYSPRAQEQL